MTHPFSLLIPVFISLSAQALLWYGYFFQINWMTINVVLWLAAAAFAAASIFLVIYRLVAAEMSPWNLGLVISSLIQFASMGSSGYFLWKIALVLAHRS